LVSGATITAITISMIFAIVIPIILLVFGRIKFKVNFKTVLIGALTFFIFVQVLEGTINALLFNSKEISTLFDNHYFFVTYVVLMAGMFEEGGRFLMMKLTMKKYQEWRDGFAFGVGHGGLESILLLGFSSINMLIYSIQINAGTFDELYINEKVRSLLEPVKEQLVNNSALMFSIGPVERICAICLHIALSILVLYAVKTGKIKYFFSAIVFHALFNIPAALYQKGIITNVLIPEIFILLFAVIGLVFIVKSRRILFGLNEKNLNYEEKNPKIQI
jgi:uncharacterized membrane protein YhfC